MEQRTLSHTESNEIEEPAVVAPRTLMRRAGKIASGTILMTGLLILKLKGLIFLIAAKFRLLLVNPFEGFGLVEFAVAAGSMVVSLVAYAFKIGIWSALGLVLLIFVHELGHAVMIRAKGLRAGGMLFIPFLGGAVSLKEQPTSAFVDAQIGLAGPVAGTLVSVLLLYGFHFTGNSAFLLIASFGFTLNLFNLLPIGPLDGGRISAAISKWMWLIGAILLFVAMIRWKSPLLFGILLLAAFQIYKHIRSTGNEPFFNISRSERATIAVTYFIVVAYLGYQTVVSRKLLQPFLDAP